MTRHYCSNCGLSLMATMKICPTCGSRSFSETPIVPKPVAENMKPVNGLGSGNGQSPFMANQQGLGSLQPASNGARFVAYLVDVVITYVGGFAMGLVFALMGIGGTSGADKPLLMGLGMIVGMFYFATFQSSGWQATPGKRLLGLIVVTKDGNRLTFARAFARALTMTMVTVLGWFLWAVVIFGLSGLSGSSKEPDVFMMLIGFVVLILGPYITVFFTSFHLTLIDMICTTRVVKK